MENEKYVGNILRYERCKRGVRSDDICSGICSLKKYNKIENGICTAGLHMKRALFQRLGLSAGKLGVFLGRNEYNEFHERLLILEAMNDFKESCDGTVVKNMLALYDNNIKKDIFNAQFSIYMSARIAELEGDIKEAFGLYIAAVECTMPDLKKYFAGSKIEYEIIKLPLHMSLDEFFIMANIARLSALEKEEKSQKRSVNIYRELIRCCEETEIEIWNLVCIYPKVLCEMLMVQTPEQLGNYERREMLARCNKALELLRQTSRLHYVGELIEKKSRLMELLGDEPDKQWDEFLIHYEYLRKRYRQTGNRFEWYPYYVDCDFYKVEKLIDERRVMNNMTMEELSDGICTYETVSRIINRKVNPTRTIVEKMLNKLGLEGILESRVVVSDSLETHKLWDMLVDCKVMDDHITGEKIYAQLVKKLDTSIEANKMVLDYERAVLDSYNENINYAEMAEKYGRMLKFYITDTDKYTCLTYIEGMVVNKYFDCMNRIKCYKNIKVLEKICDNYFFTAMDKKTHISSYEGYVLRCANYLGNCNEFIKSNRYADIGIKLELECERMHVLATLLYCIPWNKGMQGDIGKDDIDICKCAYEIAWFDSSFKSMERMEAWIKKHTKK